MSSFTTFTTPALIATLLKTVFSAFSPSFEVVGVDAKSPTPEMIGKRVGVIARKIWRLKDVDCDKAASRWPSGFEFGSAADSSDRNRAMTYQWGPRPVNEIENVPLAEVEEKELQETMGLSWDWISKEEMKARPIVANSNDIDEELVRHLEDSFW